MLVTIPPKKVSRNASHQRYLFGESRMNLLHDFVHLGALVARIGMEKGEHRLSFFQQPVEVRFWRLARAWGKAGLDGRDRRRRCFLARQKHLKRFRHLDNTRAGGRDQHRRAGSNVLRRCRTILEPEHSGDQEDNARHNRNAKLRALPGP